MVLMELSHSFLVCQLFSTLHFKKMLMLQHQVLLALLLLQEKNYTLSFFKILLVFLLSKLRVRLGLSQHLYIYGSVTWTVVAGTFVNRSGVIPMVTADNLVATPLAVAAIRVAPPWITN